MVNSVSGGSPLSFITEQPQSLAARGSAGFEQQLVAEISRSLERLGLSAGSFQVTVQADANPAARQILVSYAAPAAASPPPSPPPPAEPLDVLRRALAEAGLNPDGFDLSVSRETVNYPGGSYINHLVTAHFANGFTENYDVGLMLRDPKVTVVEMRRAAAYRAG